MPSTKLPLFPGNPILLHLVSRPRRLNSFIFHYYLFPIPNFIYNFISRIRPSIELECPLVAEPSTHPVLPVAPTQAEVRSRSRTTSAPARLPTSRQSADLHPEFPIPNPLTGPMKPDLHTESPIPNPQELPAASQTMPVTTPPTPTAVE